jgi:Na+/citrate or Na+/malate symporter
MRPANLEKLRVAPAPHQDSKKKSVFLDETGSIPLPLQAAVFACIFVLEFQPQNPSSLVNGTL